MGNFPVPDGFRVVSSERIRGGTGAPVRIVHPDPGLRLTFAPLTTMLAGWYQLELRFPPEGLVDVAAEFSFGEQVLWLRLPVIARNHFLAHVRLEGALKQLTLIVTGSGRLQAPVCRFGSVGMGGQLAAAARRGVEIFRRDGVGVVWSGLNYLWRLTRPGSIAVSSGSVATKGETAYEAWVRIFDEAPERDAALHHERLASLRRRPLISVIAAEGAVAHGLDAQIYPDFEIVSGVPNAALAAAKGAFVLSLAAGVRLRPHALLELALALEQVLDAALIYADEDRIEEGKRTDWRFKPAWSPHWLATTNYLGALILMRTEAIRAVGGWRMDASDPPHDLLVRMTQNADARVVHLAKLLVHTRAAPVPLPSIQRPGRDIANPPRVSLIIPTRDGADVLATCIRSIRSLTSYPDYEIVIVDNGSERDDTKRLFADLSADPAIRILPRPEPFNFSRLNNAAAREATGSVLALVNNDIEVKQANWLTEMVALALRPGVGCVGAKLLYPDGRIQHAGIEIGLGGVAGHGHRFAPGDDPGYLGRLRAVHEVSAVTAACLVIRREVYEEVGGLDEELTVAFNDVDFCLKVRAAGYLNLWTPFADLVHHESASRGSDLTPTKARRFADEYATMQRRWGEDLLSDPYYSPHLTYDREDYSLRLR